MPSFRPETSLAYQPALRRRLWWFAVTHGVQNCDAEGVLNQLDLELQAVAWKREPPTSVDIHRVAMRILKWRVTDYRRAASSQPTTLEAMLEENDALDFADPRCGDPLDQLIAEEEDIEEERLCTAMAAEQDRVMQAALDADQPCYRGSRGKRLIGYDRNLIRLRKKSPKKSIRKLGRVLRRYYQRCYPDFPYAHRDETLACERMANIQARIERAKLDK